jgi:tRNA A37 threonylcarbamoyltransferase TsaD
MSETLYVFDAFPNLDIRPIFKARLIFKFTLMPVIFQVVSGGSAANNAIRGALTKLAGQYRLNISFPPPKLCTDNGVMIAWAGMEKYL